jgi:hypothetical protein
MCTENFGELIKHEEGKKLDGGGCGEFKLFHKIGFQNVLVLLGNKFKKVPIRTTPTQSFDKCSSCFVSFLPRP